VSIVRMTDDGRVAIDLGDDCYVMSLDEFEDFAKEVGDFADTSAPLKRDMAHDLAEQESLTSSATRCACAFTIMSGYSYIGYIPPAVQNSSGGFRR